MQDAVNLGWKLGQVAKGTSGDALLDTYHAERHPAGVRALKYSMAQSLFQQADPRQEALRDLLDEMLEVDEAAAVIAGVITGLDVTYDLGSRHPLLGRRMPDLDIVGAGGEQRVFELLHPARPVLLELADPRLTVHRLPERVHHVAATVNGIWQLPVIGPVPAPTAVLVRPDGYVAWVGEGSTEGLAAAIRTWCGD
jgi:3-(3-hydroxy-phenyl)propionate hydroxylase